MKHHIPLDQLKHGMYYNGSCRNASVARWDANKKVFVHWRTKFGETFLEEIRPPELDQHFDVFYAESELTEVSKPIPFDNGE